MSGLFDRPRSVRWHGSTELVHVPYAACLRCGSTGHREVVVREGCLFRGWDMGADRRTTWEVCNDCGWAWIRDVTEVRPDSA